ncbi:DUF3052 family protein [Streptomyces lavendulae]|nr:DUF3052 family protein [Streptomyces lavendulae]
MAQRLGVEPGMVVQEIGYGDESVRKSAAEAGGQALVDVDYDDLVDVVLLWFRDDEGELVDALVDTMPGLAENSIVWVPTPKSGRDGSMEPSDISDAAVTAGLAQTSSIGAAPDWTGTLLASAKAARSRR